MHQLKDKQHRTKKMQAKGKCATTKGQTKIMKQPSRAYTMHTNLGNYIYDRIMDHFKANAKVGLP